MNVELGLLAELIGAASDVLVDLSSAPKTPSRTVRLARLQAAIDELEEVVNDV